MKKIVRLLCILFMFILALVGCSNSDEDDAEKVAEEFVRNIYTVDAKKVADFTKLLEAPEGSGGDVIVEGIPEGTTTEPSDEYAKIYKSLDKNIQPLMTKEGYESIIMNQFNILTTKICARDNYTAQVTDFTLGENVYEEDNDKVRYLYEVKLKFISTDGKSEQTDASTGAVELLKENGQWKVCLYGINQFPKLYK